MSELKDKTNLELARIALGCLEEITRRGNSHIEPARLLISRFYADIHTLKLKAHALASPQESEAGK